MSDLSIVIISFNTKKITKDCLDSLLEHTHNLDYEIVVVDNASSDGSRDLLSKYAFHNKKIKLVKSHENIGFAKANNLGVINSSGKYILFLNSDTYFKSDILADMVEWMDENPKVGIASCALRNKDGSLQGTGGYFPTLLRVLSWMTIQDLPFVDRIIKPFHPMKEKSLTKNERFYTKQRTLDWVTGAFMLVRRKLVDEGLSWDEDYFMYTEDVDYCFGAKEMGYMVYYLPGWSIVHLGGKSGTKEFSVLSEFRGVKLFYEKHYPKYKMLPLRLILKIGCFARMVVYGFFDGKATYKVYAKAFMEV